MRIQDTIITAKNPSSSSDSIVTRCGLDHNGCIPGRGRYTFICHHVQSGTRTSFYAEKFLGRETSLHLVPRSMRRPVRIFVHSLHAWWLKQNIFILRNHFKICSSRCETTSVTLRKARALRAFENKLLRKNFELILTKLRKNGKTWKLEAS
jgi:hypothetical protein